MSFCVTVRRQPVLWFRRKTLLFLRHIVFGFLALCMIKLVSLSGENNNGTDRFTSGTRDASVAVVLDEWC